MANVKAIASSGAVFMNSSSFINERFPVLSAIPKYEDEEKMVILMLASLGYD